jgi:hypothetical protein
VPAAGGGGAGGSRLKSDGIPGTTRPVRALYLISLMTLTRKFYYLHFINEKAQKHKVACEGSLRE